MTPNILAAALLVMLTLECGTPITHVRNHPDGAEAYLLSVAADAIDAAEAWNIDPILLVAIALNESGLNPDAVGSMGERTIWQLNPRRRDVDGNENQRDAAFLAAGILSRSIRVCDGLEEGLRMYNAGRCEPRSRYSRNVMAKAAQLRAIVVRDR